MADLDAWVDDGLAEKPDPFFQGENVFFCGIVAHHDLQVIEDAGGPFNDVDVPARDRVETS